jgi:hypothetical protein
MRLAWAEADTQQPQAWMKARKQYEHNRNHIAHFGCHLLTHPVVLVVSF